MVVLADSIHVSLLPLPYIDIGNDTYICEDDSILFDVGNHWNSVIWTNGTFQNRILNQFMFLIQDFLMSQS